MEKKLLLFWECVEKVNMSVLQIFLFFAKQKSPPTLEDFPNVCHIALELARNGHDTKKLGANIPDRHHLPPKVLRQVSGFCPRSSARALRFTLCFDAAGCLKQVFR